MIRNPILQRELMATLRGMLAVALAVLYVAVLAGVIWFMWPEHGVFSRAAQASRTIVTVFSIAQVLLVVLYAPAFAATAITSERERNSYDLLFATLLRPWEIVAGKLGASLAVLLVFVLFSFPMFAACFFLGAVSVRETILIFSISLVSAVFFGLLGLSVSAVKDNSQSALITTYLGVLLLTAGPWVPPLLLSNWAPAAIAIYYFRALSPIAAMGSVLMPTLQTPTRGAAAALPVAWELYLMFALAVSAGMVVFLLASAYVTAGHRARKSQRAIDDPRELMKRRLRFPFYLIDPMRRKRTIPLWINPVFAKELRSKAFGGGVWIFRSAYLCFAVSVGLMSLVAGNLGRQTPDVIRTVALAFQIGLVILVVPSLTAGAVTQERDRANLDLLRLTRIGPVTFLLGKLQTAFVFVLFLVVGALPLWYGIHYLGTNTLSEILRCWAVIGATVVLAMIIGLFSSSVATRTPVATALSYGIVFVLMVGTLFPLLAGDRLGSDVVYLIYLMNPFVVSTQLLTAEFFQDWPDLFRPHLVATGALAVVLLLVSYLRVRRMLLPEK